MSVLAVYREPFSFEPVVARLPEGLALSDLLARMPGLPDDFAARGVICINGHRAPRDLWGCIRPKAVANGVPVEVTFHAPPEGGGEDTGKQILALVASIALLAVTSGIAANGVKFLGIAGKSPMAYALAVGVSYVGSLALSALTAPPVAKESARQTDLANASVEGNVLAADAPIPRVVGERKIFPPFAAEPYTYFDGPDEVVEAVVCLSGPHRLNDIRVGSAPIAAVGIEYEAREGWPGDTPLTMIRRQAKTESLQSELRGHVVSDSDGSQLQSTTGDISAALPQPVILATRQGPDLHQIHIAFAQGLHEKGSETVRLRVPLRLQIRQVGASDWINLPELHFQAASIRQLRATIELNWATDSGAPTAGTNEGWVEARHTSPGQTAAPASVDYVADSYFIGAGDAYLAAGNTGTTGVQHVYMDRYKARFALDPAIFPRGRYEINLIRGAVISTSAYSSSGYTVSGSVWDLFGYRGSPARLPRTRDGVGDTLYLLRSVSVWNEPPVAKGGLALIAIRARNRALDSISTIAGGWVRDWDGTAWRTWVVTDNPAPHLRDVLAGDLNANGVPGSMIDDATLVTWRAAGWKCNAVIEGQSVGEAATLIAACGYARPYMSEIMGIARDYDRSAEAPVQIFTPRNSASFSWSKAFPRLPDGLRVTFREALTDYQERQIVVARRGFVGDPVLLEQVSYEGPVTEAEARARAIYDLDQGMYRNTFYSLDAPAEAVVCRMGDLVGIQHDLLTEQQGAGRIIAIQTSGGSIVSLDLDCKVPIQNEVDLLSVADILAVPDVLAIGAKTALIIRGESGPSNALALTNATGETDHLVLATPLAPSAAYVGALAVVGPVSTTVLRTVVLNIEPKEDLSATLTFVDEAPKIWAA